MTEIVWKRYKATES